MVTDNKGVALAWRQGTYARSHNGNFRTDGRKLYSYGLTIGITSNDGIKVLNDYRSPVAASPTTTRHCSLAKGGIYGTGIERVYARIADVILTPERAHWTGEHFPEWAYTLGPIVNKPEISTAEIH